MHSLINHSMCFLWAVFAQAQNLLGISQMSGDRKREACDKLDNIESQIGPAAAARLTECGGDYPAALQQAIAVCGSFGLNEDSCDFASQPGYNDRRSLQGLSDGPDSDGERMCNAVCTKAKAQVHLCMLLYV